MKRNTLFGLLALLIPVFMTTQVQAQKPDTTAYDLVLLGSNSVPAVSTNGTGLLTVTLVGDTLTVQGTFKNLRGYYTGAHIFYGDENEEGNALYRLTAELDSTTHTSGRFPASKNKFKFSDAHKRFLRDGMFYISITTNENPNGEIRSQIK